MSEFSKKFCCLDIVSNGRFYCGGKHTDVNEFVSEPYSRFPWLPVLDVRKKDDAFVYAAFLADSGFTSVGQILAVCAWSKVFVAVVGAYTVTVIYIPVAAAKYLTVHLYLFAFCAACSVESFPFRVIADKPVTSGETIVSVLRYDSVLPLRERNVSTWLTVDIDHVLAHFGSRFIHLAGTAEYRLSSLDVSALWAGIVLVRTLLCWCKIALRSGTSSLRRHDLSTKEILRLGRTRALYPIMEAA